MDICYENSNKMSNSTSLPAIAKLQKNVEVNSEIPLSPTSSLVFLPKKLTSLSSNLLSTAIKHRNSRGFGKTKTGLLRKVRINFPKNNNKLSQN